MIEGLGFLTLVCHPHFYNRARKYLLSSLKMQLASIQGQWHRVLQALSYLPLAEYLNYGWIITYGFQTNIIRVIKRKWVIRVGHVAWKKEIRIHIKS
jgi:hypothetical protein